MSCPHKFKEGEVKVGFVTPPPYECGFCEMDRLREELKNAAIAEHARCVELLRESHDVPHYDTRLGWADWLAARGPGEKT